MSPNAQDSDQALDNGGDENVDYLSVFLNADEDRQKLISYLKDQNMSIGCLVYNQPYMMQP